MNASTIECKPQKWHICLKHVHVVYAYGVYNVLVDGVYAWMGYTVIIINNKSIYLFTRGRGIHVESWGIRVDGVFTHRWGIPVVGV